MCDNEKTKIQLPSGCNVDMSVDIYDNYYSKFSDSQFFSFSNFINAGLYFPQIMQFITVMVIILCGKTNWLDIILCNIVSGILFTIIWFFSRLYKIPGLSFVSCLIGGNFFKYFLHFIIIAVVAFFVAKDWKVLLFCAIGGVLTSIIKTILFARFSNVKYHDEIVKYVSDFKYKN